jgi:hypothetical protein
VDGLLATSLLHFIFSKVKMCLELDFHFN